MVLAGGKAPSAAQWLMHWLETMAVSRLRPRTLEGYRSNIELHLLPHLGHHQLDRLQPEHLEACYRDLLAQGLSPATVLVNHRIISRALKVAMQRGRVARNVAALVDPPRVIKPELTPLTAGEARSVLAAAAGVANSARWSVALALGLRQGEALGLLWRDVDLTQGTLTVRRALQRQKGKGLVLVEPKSRAGVRTVALPGALRDAPGSSAPGKRSSGRSLATYTRTGASCSPSRTGGHSAPGRTGRLGNGCSRGPGYVTCGCTTRDTRRPPC